MFAQVYAGGAASRTNPKLTDAPGPALPCGVRMRVKRPVRTHHARGGPPRTQPPRPGLASGVRKGLVTSLCLALLAGCAAPAPTGSGTAKKWTRLMASQAPAGAPQIHITGYLYRDTATGTDQFNDLTTGGQPGFPVLAYTPVGGPVATRLRVQQSDPAGTDYQALLDSDPEYATAALGHVNAEGTLVPISGWTIIIGRGPRVQGRQVQTIADGTQMAVRLMTIPMVDRIYNLEPDPKGSVLCVTRLFMPLAPPITVPPGTYVDVSPLLTAEPVPVPIPDGDPFLVHVYNRATAAQMPPAAYHRWGTSPPTAPRACVPE